MIRFTPIPAKMQHTICTHHSDECFERPSMYVWDDADHDGPYCYDSPSTPGLCLRCWQGHASCGDESHVADVIRQTIDGYLPA